MLKFAFKEQEGPPDGYVWTSPTGNKIRHLNRTPWYSAILKEYRDNGIPMPADWKEQAEHQWCLIAPPGWCKHDTGEGHGGYLNVRLTAQDYLHGTVVLSQIAATPDPLVDKNIAEKRALKCAACPANIQASGCIPCMGIANFILQIKGAQTTPSDPFLNSCAICKCSCQAMVWVKAEILARHTDATQLFQMEQMPDCWKAKACRSGNDLDV